MKREIVFKGKLSHSKEWIEGNLIIAQNGKHYIIPFDVFEPDGHHIIIDSDNPFLVDKDTVSQFINKTDKKVKRFLKVILIMMEIVSFGVKNATDLNLLN